MAHHNKIHQWPMLGSPRIPDAQHPLRRRRNLDSFGVVVVDRGSVARLSGCDMRNNPAGATFAGSDGRVLYSAD